MSIRKNFIHYGMHDFNELKFKDLKKSLKTQFITNGYFCKKLENKISNITGSKFAVVCNNGTSALMMTILASNYKNIVAIVPNINFVAITSIITLLKGKIILCDINPNTGMVDPISFQKTLLKCKKKGIKPNFFFPVHYAGDILDLKEFKKICNINKISIIEDGCHSFGSKDKNGNIIGNCKNSLGTTFSFHPVKNFTTIEGGAITTNNKNFYKKLIEIRSHSLRLSKINDPYILPLPSLNFRMGEINALIGLDQLQKIQTFKIKRLKLVKYYLKKFKIFNKHFKILNHENRNIFWHLFVILIHRKSKINKNLLMQYLKKNNVGSQIHYKPIYLHKVYKKSIIINENKNALNFYKSQLTLPLYSQMRRKDVDYIYKLLIKFFKNYNLTL